MKQKRIFFFLAGEFRFLEIALILDSTCRKQLKSSSQAVAKLAAASYQQSFTAILRVTKGCFLWKSVQVQIHLWSFFLSYCHYMSRLFRRKVGVRDFPSFFAPPSTSSPFLSYLGRPIVRWFSIFAPSCRYLHFFRLTICWRARYGLTRGHTIAYCDALLRLVRRPNPSAVFKNLALDTSSRDSFYSCPDLSSLQISQPSVSVSVDALDHEFNTEPSRSPSPDHLAPRELKKRSGRQAVSRKARGVIGKVRAFQRIAAAKMAHPSIKIDTNIQTTKRGLPLDIDGGPEAGDDGQGNPRLESGNTDDIPPFLCQSVSGK